MIVPNSASIRFYHARVGFWSAITFAVLLTMLNVAFAIMVLRIPASEWQGMEAYASSYQAIAFVPQAIGLFSIPPLLLMLASIHLYAEERCKIWSLAGLLFAIAYAGLLGALYFIQVAVILPALKGGYWQGLDQFSFANPHSLAWGLDHFAWSLLGAALFCMAWVFGGDGLQRWIRWSFQFNGIANILLILAYALGSELLTLGIAFSSWVIALPASAILVALMFRKAQGTG